ncbi:hypothetical protein ACQ4PT_046967 [Festuca glaucescens]
MDPFLVAMGRCWIRGSVREMELVRVAAELTPACDALEQWRPPGRGTAGSSGLRPGKTVAGAAGQDPWLRFIPLPKLLPSNNAHYGSAFRGVVFAADDLIKCVEVEHRRRRRVHEIPDAELLYDSEFRFGTEEEECTYENLGWRIITWSRRISSDSWHKGCLVDVDEILVSNPSHGVLFPELVDDNERRWWRRCLKHV